MSCEFNTLSTPEFLPLVIVGKSPDAVKFEIDGLIRWMFQVHLNVKNCSSENISNLKKLAETAPIDAIKLIDNHSQTTIIGKVEAVFTSIRNLAENNSMDKNLLVEAENAYEALKAAFPPLVGNETPPSRKTSDLCFSPSLSITPNSPFIRRSSSID